MTILVVYTYAKRDASGKCVYGRHKTLPAKSCREVLDVQPNCYKVDGYYWIKPAGSSEATARYCDMSYKGGGWQRIYYFDSTVNSSCTGSTDLNIHGPFYSSQEYYCGTPSSTSTSSCAYITLNETNAGLFEFAEIRGNVALKLEKNSNLEGYTGWPSGHPTSIDNCDEYMSGFYVYNIFNDPNGNRQVYPLFLYLVTNPNDPVSASDSGCPVTSEGAKATEYRRFRIPFKLKGYQCDEFDISGTSDSEGIYEKDFFDLETCSQCDDSGKWFQRRYGHPVKTDEINIGFSRTSTTNSTGALYFTTLSLFIR